MPRDAAPNDRASARAPTPAVEAGVVVLAALLAGLPLLSGSLLGGHDVATYLMYAAQGGALARDGVLLPAWGAELNGGFGGPGLLFYPPLVNLPHVLLLLAGLAPAWGLGLTALIALAAALVYVASPYRMVDLYERTALSEHLAFLFPPLALLALAAARPASRRRRAVLVALAVAGLLLSNLPAAVLFGGLLALLVLLPSFGRERRLAAVAGALLGGALAAFALVPAALSGRWCATELFYSGGSPLFRPSQHVLFGAAALNPAFGRSVSLAVLALAALLLAAWGLGRWLKVEDARATPWALVALAAFLATLPPAGPLWDVLPLLSKLQFPWRLAMVLTLALSALVAFLPRRASLAVAAAAMIAAAPWWGRSVAPADSVPTAAPAPAAPGTAFPDPAVVRDAAGLSTHPWASNPSLLDRWFVPRSAPAGAWRAIVTGGATALPAFAAAPVASATGPVRWSVASWRADARSLSVEAPAGPLLLRQLWFPGFVATVDGRTVAAKAHPETGLLSVDWPGGRHEVAWRWEPFGPLLAARRVSLLAALLVLALLFVPARRA